MKNLPSRANGATLMVVTRWLSRVMKAQRGHELHERREGGHGGRAGGQRATLDISESDN